MEAERAQRVRQKLDGLIGIVVVREGVAGVEGHL